MRLFVIDDELERLMQANPLLAGILGSDLDGYVVWDLMGTAVHYSSRWRAMLGYEAQDLEVTPNLWKRLLHPDDSAGASESIGSSIDSLWPLNGTWRMLHACGQWRYIRWTGHLQRSSTGDPTMLVCRCADVTEAHLAHAREKAILDSIADTVLVVNASTLEVMAHRESAGQSGEIIAQTAQFMALPEVASVVAECAENCLSQKDIETTTAGIRRSLEIRCRRYAAEEVVILFRDVTEKKRINEQLAQAQKLESIGQLAAGVAHEINTPMQYIGDNLTFLGTAFTDLEKLLGAALDKPSTQAELLQLAESLDLEYLRSNIQTSIQNSQEGVQRVSQIISALKDFSHQGTGHPAMCDLNRALRSAVTVSASQWRLHAKIVFDLAPDLPPLLGYGAELNQVFLNLIINAAHAIRDANKTSGGQGTITLRSQVTSNGIRIEVADTGTGIPASIASRVFDPFFTTKPLGEGTGQGLSLSRDIVVKRHKGTLTFESEPGKGTTMRVDLPVSDDAVL